MIITKKRIVKVPTEFEYGTEFYIMVDANDENLKKLDLDIFEENVVVQPSIKYGPTCKKNVEGYYVIERDFPKEERFIRTIYWEWTTYNGVTMSDYKDIYKECYPRTYYEPFNIELTLLKIENKNVIITKVNDIKNIKNIINLYLEIFGYCEVLDSQLKAFFENKTYIRCNWEILPPDVKLKIYDIKNKKKNDKQTSRKNYDQARLDELEKYEPKERYIGKNGFQGYFAYLFNNICILENPLYGNATYIIKSDNWEELSKLTKRELLNSGYLLDRLEHNSNWFEGIQRNIG